MTDKNNISPPLEVAIARWLVDQMDWISGKKALNEADERFLAEAEIPKIVKDMQIGEIGSNIKAAAYLKEMGLTKLEGISLDEADLTKNPKLAVAYYIADNEKSAKEAQLVHDRMPAVLMDGRSSDSDKQSFQATADADFLAAQRGEKALALLGVSPDVIQKIVNAADHCAIEEMNSETHSAPDATPTTIALADKGVAKPK